VRPKRIAAVVSVLIVVAVVVLFTLQNIERTVDISLSLGFYGFHLENPMPIPYVIGISLIIGFAVGGGWGVAERIGAERRIRELQRKLNQTRLNGDDGWST